jgi:hypothetical protein
LEQDTKFYFDAGYLSDQIVDGEWDSALEYMRSFISYKDGPHELKAFFEVVKFKYMHLIHR